ncbi:uncharacterized protein ACA1_112190 [Acanthamoeba castellanii str. Neff]|uniref:Uncharacterized protein n=1 Tax=Acanthamoeba castellanii (strain ATCC 30010 / Neff) TaxID=1257118 RepID=L8H637_ACACF|nr:uncharacterized protein ACA1_112190 [Acanthamoeba castellanii str. Neff]ELR19946.1 hypothetical protein ACA1_112190 [Acanthamoeba castellanii str. Neff]
MLEVDALFSTLDQFKLLEEQQATVDEAQSPEAIIAHDHHGFGHHDYHQAAVQVVGQPFTPAAAMSAIVGMDLDEVAHHLLEAGEDEVVVAVTEPIADVDHLIRLLSGPLAPLPPQPPTEVFYNEVAEVEEVVEEGHDDANDDVQANERHHVLDPKKEVMVSFYAVLAYNSSSKKKEKMKKWAEEEERALAWVAFYTACADYALELDQYRLQLLELDQPDQPDFLAQRCVACEMVVSQVDAWVAAGRHPRTHQRLWQVKLPFVVEAPAGRKPRRLGMYEAVLVHRSTGMAVRLGGASVGSSSNLLRGFGPKVEARFTGVAQRRLVRNFRERSKAKNSRRARHYRSGKGSASAQTTHKPARFLTDELARAVTLPVHSTHQ